LSLAGVRSLRPLPGADGADRVGGHGKPHGLGLRCSA